MSSTSSFSTYFGIVTDVKDPDKMARVKVKIESLCDDVETDWLPVLQSYAGKESGTFLLPSTEDQVLVVFFDRWLHNGVVLGSIWSEKQKPPKSEENGDSDLNADGKNNLKFVRSKSGQRIILDDTSGKEKLTILSGDSKSRFSLDAKEKKIIIKTEQGISITAKEKLGIKAKEVKLETDKALSIKADGLGLEATNKSLEIKASQSLEAKGNSVALN
jgi:phage baseplate assembly protein V